MVKELTKSAREDLEHVSSLLSIVMGQGDLLQAVEEYEGKEVYTIPPIAQIWSKKGSCC
jgi:hypothetical protein